MTISRLFFLIISLLILSHSAFASDQSLGEISKSKYYYCVEKTYQLALKTIKKDGTVVRTVIYKRKKARKIHRNLAKEIKTISKEIKNTKSPKKKSRLKVKHAGRKVLRAGISMCLNKTLQFSSNLNLTSGTISPDTVLPESVSYADSFSSATFKGNCEYKGKFIEPYTPGSHSPILAPQSGQFFCAFTSSKSHFGDLQLKAFIKGAPKEIIFSKTIPRSSIKSGYSFITSVCTEFPGCFYSNLLAKISSESGIEVSLEELS